MLIAAFQHRQEIEASKVSALITAIVNPAGSTEAFMRFLKKLMPDYQNLRDELDQMLVANVQRDSGTVFRLSPTDVTGNNWQARQEKWENK